MNTFPGSNSSPFLYLPQTSPGVHLGTMRSVCKSGGNNTHNTTNPILLNDNFKNAVESWIGQKPFLVVTLTFHVFHERAPTGGISLTDMSLSLSLSLVINTFCDGKECVTSLICTCLDYLIVWWERNDEFDLQTIIR
ncbi:hypothetical protein TNCV_1044701 [Trichonephila clavipes]|nr:hypothetical protein TNCV_1044701 [Trichonephila clavipes]